MSWILDEKYPYKPKKLKNPESSNLTVSRILHTVYDNELLANYHQLKFLKTYFIFVHIDEDLAQKAKEDGEILREKNPEYFL